jgi:hypothetical protein
MWRSLLYAGGTVALLSGLGAWAGLRRKAKRQQALKIHQEQVHQQRLRAAQKAQIAALNAKRAAAAERGVLPQDMPTSQEGLAVGL